MKLNQNGVFQIYLFVSLWNRQFNPTKDSSQQASSEIDAGIYVLDLNITFVPNIEPLPHYRNFRKLSKNDKKLPPSKVFFRM